MKKESEIFICVTLKNSDFFNTGASLIHQYKCRSLAFAVCRRWKITWLFFVINEYLPCSFVVVTKRDVTEAHSNSSCSAAYPIKLYRVFLILSFISLCDRFN